MKIRSLVSYKLVTLFTSSSFYFKIILPNRIYKWKELMHKDYTSINVLFQECGIVVDDIGHDYINNIKTIVIYAYPIDSLFVCPSCGSII